MVVAAISARLAATRHHHSRRPATAPPLIVPRLRLPIICTTARYAALNDHAPERSAQLVNRMAQRSRRSMKKATQIEAMMLRAAEWIAEADARVRNIHRSHDIREEFRKALAAAEAEAQQPAARGRYAVLRTYNAE